ncbi:methionyl-tRNA formyltransferase [Corynebacterium aquatimens]|uniref:Methionyl-tRNA formyltransferase n=1 Tax=Corynebacterium aquatimens TaxID=1190508 RepID=A0A931E1K7_9CORY|nr:methionyl-tRNA formyltransferase [Corynebacterium aquatimens]MBG6121676.1 methionyl-tRNA formyltransferase [Corynebacterium aquatimens]WJY65785.1 Methionyl-tRNA formyltransferase [Corynebacterium aquatimens]
MRLIFAGTPEPAVESLRALIDSRHEVVTVLTRPDARKSRGRTLHPSPVKALAEEHGIEVLTPETLKANDEIRQRLRDLAPDCIPVVAYGNLIPDDMLDIPTHGWVNLHFSVLPNWRGAAPVQHAILAGDDTTGVSVFRIDSGLDTGDVILSTNDPIAPEDTAGDLLERLARGGANALVEAMDMLEDGTAQLTKQPEEGTYASKITTDDARIDWTQPVEVVDRAIRAFTPAPGAWTTLGGDRVKVGPVTPAGTSDLQPGDVTVTKKHVSVGTGTGDVILGTIQPPGKKMMNAADWGRGLSADVVEGLKFQ